MFVRLQLNYISSLKDGIIVTPEIIKKKKEFKFL